MRENISLVKHAHIANLVGRTIPTPTRHEDGLVDFLKTLKTAGYAGGVSVECYSQDILAEAGPCRAFMQQFK
ncbi:MAG: hypothetical protein LBU23_11560, partial [Planctomycetota bacterium]|jgi:sugar phosphate isomerase/epimerase|nr:hypothetical protein [Planctomycetota bacterium]